MNVVKLLHVPIIFTGMKEFILEGNPVKVFIMVKPFYNMVVSKYLR
jgi:energy-converting hydrogenase Eha subunit C